MNSLNFLGVVLGFVMLLLTGFGHILYYKMGVLFWH
ncbi:hypothetical protein ES703_29221 [subsurface metagenome]